MEAKNKKYIFLLFNFIKKKQKMFFFSRGFPQNEEEEEEVELVKNRCLKKTV
jgi:hypothetical protein